DSPPPILVFLCVQSHRQSQSRRSHFERPVAYLKLELAKGSNHQDKGRGFYQKIKPRNTKAPPVRLRFSMVSESSALRKLSRNASAVSEAPHSGATGRVREACGAGPIQLLEGSRR